MQTLQIETKDGTRTLTGSYRGLDQYIVDGKIIPAKEFDTLYNIIATPTELPEYAKNANLRTMPEQFSSKITKNADGTYSRVNAHSKFGNPVTEFTEKFKTEAILKGRITKDLNQLQGLLHDIDECWNKGSRVYGGESIVFERGNTVRQIEVLLKECKQMNMTHPLQQINLTRNNNQLLTNPNRNIMSTEEIAAGETAKGKKAPAKKVVAKKVVKKGADKKPLIKKGKVAKAPGVIASILEFITGSKGETKETIIAKLAKRFPDRNADDMAKTVNCQIGGKQRPLRMEAEKKVKLTITEKDGIKTFTIKK